MIRVLVDADNVPHRRLQPVLDVLADCAGPVHVTASGRRGALDRLAWPPDSHLMERQGWQQADIALAQAYSADAEPLVLITGDGDFGLLAARHPGPVLVVSGAASGRLRDGTTVVDPALEGTAVISRWLATHAAGPNDVFDS